MKTKGVYWASQQGTNDLSTAMNEFPTNDMFETIPTLLNPNHGGSGTSQAGWISNVSGGVPGSWEIHAHRTDYTQNGANVAGLDILSGGVQPVTDFWLFEAKWVVETSALITDHSLIELDIYTYDSLGVFIDTHIFDANDDDVYYAVTQRPGQFGGTYDYVYHLRTVVPTDLDVETFSFFVQFMRAGSMTTRLEEFNLNTAEGVLLPIWGA